MKRWQKVVTGIAATAIVLCVAGVGAYKLYVVPHILEPAAERASLALSDEELKNAMNSMAVELKEEGILDEYVFEQYFADAVDTTEQLKAILGTAVPEEEIETIEAVADNMGVNISQVAKGEEPITNNNAWELKNQLSSSGVSSDSIDKVTSAMDVVPDPPVEEEPQSEESSSGNKGSSSSGGESSSGSSSSSDKGSSSSSSKDDSDDESSSSSSSGSTAYERIKNAASASEFAAGAAILGKIDVGTVMSLYSSDRAACKEYITSRLSPSEISTALALYGKYSHLL